MAEKSTLARPYAQALFGLAKQQSQLSQWTKTLELLTQMVREPQLDALIANPNIPRAVVLEILFELAGDKLARQEKSLLKILAENTRLPLLPEIAAQYAGLRAAAENTMEAELIAAFKVSDAQRKRIEQGLNKRLGLKVELRCRVDPSLIGGAIIHAGDLVIDASIATRLEHLATHLGT